MPDFTTKQREKLAEENEAMPDGSYPIRNRADLKRAIQAFGRSKNPEKTKAWIKKRARELDAEDLIPESWKEAQHSDDSEYLIHYGVTGMKWGVRRARVKSKKTISRKEYSSTVKKNKQILRANQQKWLLSYGNKKAMQIIQKENKTAVEAINEARVKRGKKKVNKILHNLPGTLV